MTSNASAVHSCCMSALLIALAVGTMSMGCGDQQMMDGGDEARFGDNQAVNGNADEGMNADNDLGNDDDFIPEEEEFLVEHVASTEHHVFVPNQSDESNTVALIDGRDFSVVPFEVGLQPVEVAAADVDGQGSVGFVLSTGEPTVSVVRAGGASGQDGIDVRLLPVPREVNRLAMAPDGRHLIAYIDPDEPINDSGSTISLQTMALIRLGDEPGDDEVFELSATRSIDTIAFSNDGQRAFIVGKEGINHLVFDDIKSDTSVPRLQLGMVDAQFPPEDQEVVVSTDGSTIALRTSEFSGVGLFELSETGGAIQRHRVVELDAIPTDLELVERDDESMQAVAAIRSAGQVAQIDVEAAFDADDGDDSFVDITRFDNTDVGSVRMLPDNSGMLLYSTLPIGPRVGFYDLDSGEVDRQTMRNEIRSLDISPDGATAVAVHQRQGGTPTGSSPVEQFRHSEGITLWDLETGFLRPIRLHGYPESIAMTTGDDGRSVLYVMLVSDNGGDQGVKRIDLETHATVFSSLARTPTQLGAVADQIFVSQKQETGRITFFDVVTNAQRTVSGYELNAGIE